MKERKREKEGGNRGKKERREEEGRWIEWERR